KSLGRKPPGQGGRPPRLGRGARLEVPRTPSFASARVRGLGKRRAGGVEVGTFGRDRYPRASGRLRALPDAAPAGARGRRADHGVRPGDPTTYDTPTSSWSRIRTCDRRVISSVLYR